MWRVFQEYIFLAAFLFLHKHLILTIPEMFRLGQVKAVNDIKKMFKPDKSDFDDLL